MKNIKRLLHVSLCTFMLSVIFFACSKDDDPILEEDLNIEEPIDEELETLTFTPNESFFSPIGTLSAHLRDKTTGNIYNKYEYYDFISDWKVLTDTISFGIEIKTTGDLIINPEMAIPASQDGSEILIYLDGEPKSILLFSTGSESTYEIQDEVAFSDVTVGFHQIKLQLKTLKSSGSNVGNLNNVHITGTAAKNAENVMRRYRANAVHSKWGTASSNNVEISVHELTIVSTKQSFYQPVTTPFGYTGSTWDKDTQTFGGYNFSLWSYGQNDPVPPFYQESHLIAVGPGLELGTYGHEGTGVKPRGDHPYIGQDTNVQTIAVRKVPGEKYDTYWSYYLDPETGHWELYGCGKKYNSSGSITYLWTGAFVEVPGAASKARSGHEICETQYRGWQMDTTGNWHPINTMIGGTGQNDISFRDWRIVGNKFTMQMGGWGEPGIENKTLTLSSPDGTPDYLKGAYLDELYAMPATFVAEAPTEILNRSAKISFNVTDLGTSASAELFWGTEEGLTKEDKWADKMSIPVKLGSNVVSLDDLIEDTDYFYRFKIKNNEGITWSLNTLEFKTTNVAGPAIIPVANFEASTVLITKESSVLFTDLSTNYPDSWTWNFEGGSPSTSSEENPIITYNTPGTYAVSLTATNSAGSNTKTESTYITVTEGGSGTLEAHYAFDGDILDATSYHRDLSIVGGFVPTYTSDHKSNSNKAYSAPADGANYLENAYKGISGNAQRTVSAWFKTTAEGSRKSIVSWGDNQEGKMFNIMIHEGRIRVEAGSSSLRGATNNLDNDAWHHVAITFDAADGDKLKDVKVYVDGVLDTNTPDGDGNSYRSEEVVINTDVSTNNMRIGSASYSSSYYWRGSIDDVRVYSDVLTVSQILALTQ